MRQIVPDHLWIGNAIDVRDARRLLDAGIEAVVDLAYEEPLAVLTRDIVYCRFPIIDGSGNRPQLLVTAIDTVTRLIRRHVPTLVGCGAGMSRSPAIVAVALSILRGDSPENCLRELILGIPHDVSPTLWNDVKKAYNELTG